MTGAVKRIDREKPFCFIRVGAQDYFLHKTEYDGDWWVLVNDSAIKSVQMEFEPIESSKGLRATLARRIN